MTVEMGDLLEVDADAFVSPANSFGFMDGGIDAALNSRFPGVQNAVQSAIADLGGMLPVGEGLVVETGDPFVPYLVCAPTMQIPQDVSHTSNAFRAMLAVLSVVDRFNSSNRDAIGSVAVPGLCTGVGRMPPEEASMQMSRAYEEWLATR